jgi:hypothetical protein
VFPTTSISMSTDHSSHCGFSYRQSRVSRRYCTKDQDIQTVQGRSCAARRGKESSSNRLRSLRITERCQRRCSPSSSTGTDNRYYDGTASERLGCFKYEWCTPRTNFKSNPAYASKPNGGQDITASRSSRPDRGCRYGRLKIVSFGGGCTIIRLSSVLLGEHGVLGRHRNGYTKPGKGALFMHLRCFQNLALEIKYQ